MILKYYKPSLSLMPFIKGYELRDFCFSPGENEGKYKPYPPAPEQYIELFVRGTEQTDMAGSLGMVTKPQALLTGQFTQRINRYVSQEFCMIKVVLLPGAVYQLTGIPGQELLNRFIDLANLYPEFTRGLMAKLQDASQSYDHMIGVLDKELCHLFRTARAGSGFEFHAISRLSVMREALNMEQLSYESCLSARQLERRVKEVTGMTPETFGRIARFHQAYALRLQHKDWNWLRIAMECGFHDYQHLAREFKAFTGVGPNDFLGEDRLAPGRVLGLR